MNDDQNTWTLDDSARASNPGDLRVSFVRWFRHYPKWPLIWFFSFMLFAIAGYFVHWSLWIFAVLLLAMNWFYWQRVRDHFRHGCVNPAIIVSVDPMLIAVSTDLTKGVGEFPAVKIIEKKLTTVCGQLPKIGTKLPTVALYQMSPDEDLLHWESFDPRPIDTATGDLDAIKQMMSTLTTDDWNELNELLGQVPRPYRCGLFRLEAKE